MLPAIAPPRRPAPIMAMFIIALIARLILSIGKPPAFDALCGDLAMIAVISAAIERRTAAMLAAAALAAGLAPQGVVLLPFAIGIAIQRRVTIAAVGYACGAGALGIACAHIAPDASVIGAVLAAQIGIWGLAAMSPGGGVSLTAVLAAAGIGTVAWYMAALTARPVAGRDTIAGAVLGAAGSIVMLPVPADSLIVAVAIAAVLPDRRPMALLASALLAASNGQALIATLCVAGASALIAPLLFRRSANDNAPIRCARRVTSIPGRVTRPQSY